MDRGREARPDPVVMWTCSSLPRICLSIVSIAPDIFTGQLPGGALCPVSILAKEPAQFEGHFPSLYLDIGLDGLVVYDTDGYVAQKLDRIRQLIEEAGLYRERREGELMWWFKRQPARHWGIEWDGLHEYGP